MVLHNAINVVSFRTLKNGLSQSTESYLVYSTLAKDICVSVLKFTESAQRKCCGNDNMINQINSSEDEIC